MQQGSPAYWFALWLTAFVVVVGGSFAMFEIDGRVSPNNDLKYAQLCANEHGSFTIQEHQYDSERTCTIHQ